MASRRSLGTSTPTSTSSSPPVSPGKPLATGKIAAGSAGTAAPRVTPEVRRALIAERAYLRAEKRGFVAGKEAEDWLAAEVEIDLLLKASRGGSSQ